MGGEASFEVIRRRIAEAAPSVEESMASAAEQLIQQGIEQGIERGVRTTLLRQLGVRFGPLSRELEERVARATAEELDRCIERIVTASRPEDVFE